MGFASTLVWVVVYGVRFLWKVVAEGVGGGIIKRTAGVGSAVKRMDKAFGAEKVAT